MTRSSVHIYRKFLFLTSFRPLSSDSDIEGNELTQATITLSYVKVVQQSSELKIAIVLVNALFTSEALHSVWFALLERPFADWLSTPRMRSATQRPGTAQSEIMTVGSTYRLRARFACHEVDVARDLDVVQQRLLFRLVFSLGKQRLIDPFRTHVRSLITGIATTQPPAHLLRQVPIFHHRPDRLTQT